MKKVRFSKLQWAYGHLEKSQKTIFCMLIFPHYGHWAPWFTQSCDVWVGSGVIGRGSSYGDGGDRAATPADQRGEGCKAPAGFFNSTPSLAIQCLSLRHKWSVKMYKSILTPGPRNTCPWMPSPHKDPKGNLNIPSCTAISSTETLKS